MACYLPDSEKEVAWIYLTKDGTTSTLLDLTGTRVLLDGGAQINDMFKLFRHPEVAVVTVATSETLNNVVELNKTNYLPVVGRVPKVNGRSPTALAIKELENQHAHVLTPKVVDSRKIEPQVIYKSLRAGTLELYPLSGDAKEIEALQKAIESGDEQKIMEEAANASVVSLIVWVPTRRDHFVKRILHTGLAPYKKIVEGLEKLKSLPLVDKPSITVEEYRKGGVVKPPAVIKLGASLPSKTTGATRVAARTAAAIPPVARNTPRPAASSAARAPITRPAAFAARGTTTRPSAGAPTSRPTPSKPTPATGRSAPGSTKSLEIISKTTAPAKPGRTATGSTRPVAAVDKLLTKKTVGTSQGVAPSRLGENKGTASPKPPIKTATKVAGAVAAGVVAAGVANVVKSKEPEPVADPFPPVPEPLDSQLDVSTPEPVNDEGLLEVGEPPMTLRKVSMDTDDIEAQKIVEQLSKEVDDAVKECENVMEQDAQRFREADETDLVKEVSSSSLIPLDEGLADTSIGGNSVTGALCGAMEHMSLDGSPKSIETSLNMDSGSSLNESIDAYSPRKESTQAEADLLGSLSSPFTTGLASTIASKIVDGATVEGAKKNAEGFLDHVLGEFDQLSNVVEHTVENALDNLAFVGHKISQDFNSLRSTTYSHTGEGEEPREIKYEETDPAIEKVLDTLSNESGEVDRKLSTANTPIEESHINGNGHEVQHGHDFPPGVVMHLPSRVAGKPAVPRNTKNFYFDLAFAPRVGTEIAFKDPETATAYFTHVRATNIILPSDNLPTFVLESWLQAKNLSTDREMHSTLLPTIECPNVTAFRQMNEEELLQNGLTLKLGLDHCTTKVVINDEERPFNVVKLDL